MMLRMERGVPVHRTKLNVQTLQMLKVFISANDVDNNDIIIPIGGYWVGFKLFHNNKSIAKSGSERYSFK